MIVDGYFAVALLFAYLNSYDLNTYLPIHQLADLHAGLFSSSRINDCRNISQLAGNPKRTCCDPC